MSLKYFVTESFSSAKVGSEHRTPAFSRSPVQVILERKPQSIAHIPAAALPRRRRHDGNQWLHNSVKWQERWTPKPWNAILRACKNGAKVSEDWRTRKLKYVKITMLGFGVSADTIRTPIKEDQTYAKPLIFSDPYLKSSGTTSLLHTIS
jgi:hypothetical protein